MRLGNVYHNKILFLAHFSKMGVGVINRPSTRYNVIREYLAVVETD